jgi:HK97 family phage major capsid protein
VPVFLPANAAAGRPQTTLMGIPVENSEHAETLGTEGDMQLVDLDQYLMIDKGGFPAGIQSASSIHVRFIYDETTFRFVYRCDGQPIWNTALVPFKGTATQSPFVVLQ